MIASSAAVVISDIPFGGPVAAVRACWLEGELIINPTFKQIMESQLDIVVAGTSEGITMVEGGANEVSEETLLGALEKAHAIIKDLCGIQIELRRLAGREKLPLSSSAELTLEKRDEILDYVYPKMETACFVKGKQNRSKAIGDLKAETFAAYAESIPPTHEKVFDALMEEIENAVVRKAIVERGLRTDGRGPEDIRPITCEIGVLPRTHGSALFTRGETQALAVTTLGTVFDEQIMDDIEGDKRENFMLHYNFPPFSVGETGRLATGRREIGHGHLAYRAVSAMLPEKTKFPYTIRLVSEILESNGSSSMATVCGSTLSLLNAGVPMKKPVAGIAMGLIQEKDKTVILSDILGEEDHLGDMDFKVAGTENGITAFQMDIKISGVSPQIMKQALDQARRGRMHILGIMNAVISAPSSDLSEYAPRIITMKIDPEKIGLLIGPGGKTIKGISEKYEVRINVENDGLVTIYSSVKASGDAAQECLHRMMEEPEVGKVYTGVVRRIMDFGAFIEFLPGKEGLCHISKMSAKRINTVSDVLSLNQEVQVKIIEIDKMGRINLGLLYQK
jgi:polyribonucleotide nucleotidyltransferase